MRFFIGEQLQAAVGQFADHKENILAQIFAVQDLAPLPVNDFPLLIHHVIVFQHMFTGIEMMRFDLLLRLLDRTRNQRMLDRFIFFHAQFVHQRRDVVGAEQTHQVIFQRQIEA